jgi:DNA-binding GntR family transcriptional regulator
LWVMKRKNKADFAYEEIRKLILAKTLESGERLVERAWAQRLSVNQADVRQALSRLVGEGLLEHGAKGGAFVPQPDPNRESEYFQARMAVEIGAAWLAVKKATQTDLEELEKIVELMGSLAQRDMYTSFNEVDMHFHEVMVQAAHSPHLMDVYHRANFPLTLSPPQYRENTLNRDARRHRKILDALVRRNFSLLSKRLAEGYEGFLP